MSELIQCPIITSPPSPPPASRPANSIVRDGKNFEDVLKAQLESDKSSGTSNESNSTSTNSSVKAVRTDSQSKTNQGEKLSNSNNKNDEIDQVSTDISVVSEVNVNISFISQPIQAITEQPQPTQANVVESGIQIPEVTLLKGEAVSFTKLEQQPSTPANLPAEEEASLEIQNNQNSSMPQVTKISEDSNTVKVDNGILTGDSIQKDDTKVNRISTQNEQTDEAVIKVPLSAVSETHADKISTAQNKVPIKPDAIQVTETNLKNVEVNAEKPPQVQAPPGESPGKMVGGVTTTQVENPITQAIEPDRLAEAQTTNIIGQIARHMDKLTQTGRQTLRIQLYPQELGHIDLKITSSPQGVGVTMLADNPTTGKLLEGQMAQLRQNLTDAGIQIANMQIGTQSNQQFNQGTPQSPNQTQAKYSMPNMTSDVSGEEPVQLIESLIDYKI